ncbi:hypothetical protein HHI36_007901 [Cryptolaemus montrouzieri]|uniref:Uncharacterized protein n=1 Tax=Cryptolaemus montrouzieri TaxID=559131 RepID=A0ABD2MRG8_9CUCU
MSETSEFYDTNVDMIEQFENCVGDYESDSGSDIVVPVNRSLRVISDSNDSEDDLENKSQSNAQFVEQPSNATFTKQTDQVFLEVCGPMHAPQGDAAPLEYFNVFFTELSTTLVEAF